MIDLEPLTIGFPFIDEVSEPLIRLTGVGVEVRDDASYYFDNKNRHIESYLFQYTLAGSGIFEIDGKKSVMTPGEAFFTYIPSETKYYFEGGEWKFIFVLFMGNNLGPYYRKILSMRGNIFHMEENDPALKGAVGLYESAKEGMLDNSLIASSAAFDFLTKLCLPPNESGAYSYLTRQAMEILQSRYADISGILEAADTLGVSQSHLTRVFTAEVKSTPLEYLTKIRLNHALRLLVDTNFPTDKIARLCGYDNGNYFGKVFKKYMRTTPMKYRETRRL